MPAGQANRGAHGRAAHQRALYALLGPVPAAGGLDGSGVRDGTLRRGLHYERANAGHDHDRKLQRL